MSSKMKRFPIEQHESYSFGKHLEHYGWIVRGSRTGHFEIVSPDGKESFDSSNLLQFFQEKEEEEDYAYKIEEFVAARQHSAKKNIKRKKISLDDNGSISKRICSAEDELSLINEACHKVTRCVERGLKCKNTISELKLQLQKVKEKQESLVAAGRENVNSNKAKKQGMEQHLRSAEGAFEKAIKYRKCLSTSYHNLFQRMNDLAEARKNLYESQRDLAKQQQAFDRSQGELTTALSNAESGLKNACEELGEAQKIRDDLVDCFIKDKQ